MGRASLDSEHGEDPRTTPDVQHGLVFEEMWIVYDRGTIRTRAHGVLQHLLVNTWKGLEHTSMTPHMEDVTAPKCAYESA